MKQPISKLKEFFGAFKMPTAGNFADMIDSFVHKDSSYTKDELDEKLSEASDKATSEYYAISENATVLPVPPTFPDGSVMKVAWTNLKGGVTYVQAGGPSLVVPANFLGRGDWKSSTDNPLQGVWKLTTQELPLADVSGKVDKDSIAIENKLIPTYENQFDKLTMVKDGYALDETGGDFESIGSTCTKAIPVNHNYPIYVLRNWIGTPRIVNFYREDGSLIKQIYVAENFKSGLLDSNSDKSIFYVRANLYSSQVSGSDKQANINSFMIYSGERLLAEYIPYSPSFSNLDGKKIAYDMQKISNGFADFEDKQNRELTYDRPINFLPKDSRADLNSVIKDGYLGKFQIRPANGGELKGGFIQLTTDGTGPNQGLLYSFIFRPSDLGKTLYYDFEARTISGSNTLRIYGASAQVGHYVDETLSTDWKKHKGSVVLGTDNIGGDYRLIIGIPNVNGTSPVSKFDIKNLSFYFTEPDYSDVVEPKISLPEFFGDLPTVKLKLSQLEAGLDVVLIMEIFGDSYTDGVPGMIQYARDFSRLLRGQYGDGGGGIYDFAQNSGNNQKHACIDPLDASDTRSGTINYFDANPLAKWANCNHAQFTQGATITLNVLRPHTALVIHYYGGGGTFEYILDGGSSVVVNTSAQQGHQTIILNVSDTTHTLKITATLGSTIIFGVDMQRSRGVRIHKVGNRGLHAYHYTTVSENDWKGSFASLNPDAVTLLIGTNDRTVLRSPADYKVCVKHFIDMVKAVDQYIDFLIIGPNNNQQIVGYTPMEEYVKQLVDLCNENELAFYNLIPILGSSEKIIAKGLLADAVHPTTQVGGIFANKLFSFITK